MLFRSIWTARLWTWTSPSALPLPPWPPLAAAQLAHRLNDGVIRRAFATLIFVVTTGVLLQIVPTLLTAASAPVPTFAQELAVDHCTCQFAAKEPSASWTAFCRKIDDEPPSCSHAY